MLKDKIKEQALNIPEIFQTFWKLKVTITILDIYRLYD